VVGGSPTTLTFVLPYKRFATPCLLSRAGQYLERPQVTYRESVREERSLIGYPLTATGGAPGEVSSTHQSVVDHSLIWRMVGWLGGLTWALDRARTMLLQSDVASLCHRLEGNVAPHKARSLERLSTLETARQLLRVIPEWEACFGCKFFPRFATRSGFD
jgi:hypothetical protein